MRILHTCLSNHFIHDRAYQENELVAEHARQGHDVLVIAATQMHDDRGHRAYGEPGESCTAEGVPVVRIPYHPALPHLLVRSLRIHRGVYRMIAAFRPDAILFHGIAGWELVTVARYVRDHPEVRFFADTHTDAINSGRSFLSMWGLHRGFYRPVIQHALPQIEKVLCISDLTEEYARDVYGIPPDKLEFYPLGGHPLSDRDLARRRAATRAAMRLADDAVVFLQSGKQTAPKHLIPALRAFAATPDPRFRFLIAGVLMDDIAAEAEALIAADDRVRFLGWTAPGELEDLLCAADVYLQPGRQSSTMQTSLCCHCAVVLEALSSHRRYVDGNGWLIDAPAELPAILAAISADPGLLDPMKRRSAEFARDVLDYAQLARRILR